DRRWRGLLDDWHGLRHAQDPPLRLGDRALGVVVVGGAPAVGRDQVRRRALPVPPPAFGCGGPGRGLRLTRAALASAWRVALVELAQDLAALGKVGLALARQVVEAEEDFPRV